MLYTVAIPAQYAAEFAAGSVALMNTSKGVTTALVNSSTGTVVAWASLVPVTGTAAGVGSAAAAASGSGGAIAATAGGVALGPLLVIGLSGVAAVGLGMLLWRRSRRCAAADTQEMVEFIVECDEADAAAVLAEVNGIIEAAAAPATA